MNWWKRLITCLADDKERAKIAKAGQGRTLKDHSYYNRMKELLEILKDYVN
jgi:spore maturation protein CgeB